MLASMGTLGWGGKDRLPYTVGPFDWSGSDLTLGVEKEEGRGRGVDISPLIGSVFTVILLLLLLFSLWFLLLLLLLVVVLLLLLLFLLLLLVAVLMLLLLLLFLLLFMIKTTLKIWSYSGQ